MTFSATNFGTSSLSRRRLLCGALGGALATSTAGITGRAAAATTWPSQPVKLVVGFPAGTSSDLLARLVGPALGDALGQPVIIENRVGAGGALGAEAVAKSRDQHTFGVIGNAALTSVLALYPKVNYKVEDFKSVTVIAGSPMMVVASNSAKFERPADFFRAAKAAGKAWSFGSLGIGSASHLFMEMLKARNGLAAVHVPYNAAPAVMNGMIAGDIQMAVLPIGNALAMVEAGRIRSVAVTSSHRTELAPNVAALPDLGVAALDVEIWNGIVAPATVPADHLRRFSEAVVSVLQMPDVRARIASQGWKPEGSPAQALDNRIRDEGALYRKIIAELGITVSS